MRQPFRVVALLAAVAIAGCTGQGPSSTPSPEVPASVAPSRSMAPAASDEPAPTTPAPSTVPALDRWSLLTVDGRGPAAREDHTWTAGAAGVAWLFGGRDGGEVFGDLWRYDPGSDGWTEMRPAGPTPPGRFGHTGTWVDGVGLVVWSGQAGSTFFDDLWAYDPDANAWRRLPSGGAAPPARYGSCAALGPDGRLWISHGFTAEGGRFDDTRVYAFASGTWEDATADGPIVRCLHDCLFTPDGELVLYAGQTNGKPAIGDLWARAAGGAWTEPATDGEAPPPRQLYSISAIGDRAWVFGGGGEDGSKLGDLWVLDLEALAWHRVQPAGDGPSPRSGAAMIADPDGSRILLFGGTDGRAASAELWELAPAR